MYTCMYVCTYVCMDINMVIVSHTYTLIHIHIHTQYIHTYIHNTYIQVKSQKFQADRKLGYMILSLNHIQNAVQTLHILTHI